MRDHLQLCLNGGLLQVTGDDAFVTLAEFLRNRRRLTGTKVVCEEGDCGACAVLVGRVSVDEQCLVYTSVNSCIQFMFQLDATHVITVEGLKYEAQLNPVQKAMVECHGTQCGFCTPGFVVGLCDLMQKRERIEVHDVRRGLVGNLCRCTGYDSIVRAAMQVDREDMKELDELYPQGELLPKLKVAASEEVGIESGGRKFSKPTTIESALRFRKENPDSLIVSGATDLGVQRNKGSRQFNVVMSTTAIRELHGIHVSPTEILIGAGETLSELERVSAIHLPELSRFLAYFGSGLIKNAATLAGNIVNASPIGDMLPAFYVLEGEVEIAGPTYMRWVGIEKFYTGYRKTVLRSDEIVARLRLPLPVQGEHFKLYKISKRKDLDISSFGAAIWMRRADSRIEQIHIAYGGVGPMIMRLRLTEDFLAGKTASKELFAEAGAIARSEINPISDVRGSENYRRTLATNILLKFWQDIDGHPNGDDLAPLPAGSMRKSLEGLPL
jgi:xanthine dehydrogenase small subunit